MWSRLHDEPMRRRDDDDDNNDVASAAAAAIRRSIYVYVYVASTSVLAFWLVPALHIWRLATSSDPSGRSGSRLYHLIAFTQAVQCVATCLYLCLAARLVWTRTWAASRQTQTPQRRLQLNDDAAATDTTAEIDDAAASAAASAADDAACCLCGTWAGALLVAMCILVSAFQLAWLASIVGHVDNRRRVSTTIVATLACEGVYTLLYTAYAVPVALHMLRSEQNPLLVGTPTPATATAHGTDVDSI
jgi:hypothetical protein